jgi:3-oxoacyl-[acyl-carrier protein] reductase
MTVEIDLSGRRALVTGAGQGVGRGIARTLAAAGAEVFVNDLVEARAASVVAEIEAAGGSGGTAVFDVTDWPAVEAKFAELGRIDILVNNAGNAGKADTMGFDDIAPFHEEDPATWDAFIRVNLFGVMYVTRAAMPGMVEGGWGRIITIVSDAGRVGEAYMAAYCAAKAGAAGMVRSVAREGGRYGITSNCLALGTMNQMELSPEEEAATYGTEGLKRYIIRRRGLPSDVANMATFLASDLAPWITGQTIPVNGGYSLAL